MRRQQWEPYQEPELLSLRAARRMVLASRCAVLGWAVATLIVAVRARTRLLDGTQDVAALRWMASLGVAPAIAVAAAGWFWCDRTTRNIHRLSGRLPGRFRCITAWSAPIVWTAVLVATVLRLGASEFDVRPMIITLVFVTAMWRPYSLVRRLIRSLIRINSDLLVGAAFVLGLGSMGLLWWRVQTLPRVSDVDDVGVGGVIGLAAFAVIAAGCNVAVWSYLLRDVDRAVEHRRVALRTRHDHNQLRRRGIDPLDPEVRLALQRIREEDEAAGAAAAAASDHATEEGAATVERPGPAAPREELEAPSAEVLGTEPPVDADGEPPVFAPPTAPPDRTPLDRIASRLASDPDLHDEPEIPLTGTPATPARPPVTDPAHSSDDDVAASAEPVSEQPAGTGPPADRVVALERLVHRLSSTERTGPSLLDRLSQYGIEAGPPEPSGMLRDLTADSELVNSLSDPPIAIGAGARSTGAADSHGAAGGGDDRDGDPIVRRVATLELARYVLLASVVAAIAAMAWFLQRTTAVEDLVEGALVAGDVDRLDEARRAAVSAIDVALVLVPLWCAAVATWSNRVGLAVKGRLRCVVLFGVLAAGNVAIAVLDPERGAVSLLAAGFGLFAALWSLRVMTDVQREFERSTTSTALFSVLLGFVIVTTWIGGLRRPIAPNDSLETMSFVGGLLVVSIAGILIVAALATADVLEAIQLSSGSRRGRDDERSTAVNADTGPASSSGELAD